jgi:hypothetical protein
MAVDPITVIAMPAIAALLIGARNVPETQFRFDRSYTLLDEDEGGARDVFGEGVTLSLGLVGGSYLLDRPPTEFNTPLATNLVRAPSDGMSRYGYQMPQSPNARLDELLDALNAFSLLPPGWDGEESVLPTRQALEAAEAFVRSLPPGVPYPRPMLSNAGHPEFYWDSEHGYVDVSIDPAGVASWFGKSPEGLEFFESGLAPNFGELPQSERAYSLVAPHLLKQAA